MLYNNLMYNKLKNKVIPTHTCSYLLIPTHIYPNETLQQKIY